MSVFEWKYISPLKSETAVDVIELQYHYQLPADLKTCLEQHNAGVPSPSTFDLPNRKKMVFGSLLSFNKEDVDSFYDFAKIFETENGKELKLFPFGLDPSGNFFCVQDNKIVLYDHESDKSIYISDSFTAFLNMLY